MLGLIAATTALAADAVDEAKPHGRVCLALFEPGPPEKEEAFRISAPPAAGKTVRAYIDASDKCSVFLAALTKDGKLANGWRPQFSEVAAEYEEIILPKTPAKWEWATASGPFDLYVVFLAPGSKELEEVRKLVDAMQNPKVDDRVLGMQTTRLKELLGRLAADKDKMIQLLSQPEVGGVFRGTAFPWRQHARAVNFSTERPGALVLSSESAEGK